jgi:8-oxo-dGTP diphosphatase
MLPAETHHVVAVILRRADQILLCHRAPGRRWYPDVWDFAGGHVEPGETPEAALRREVAEELGATLTGVDGAPVLRRRRPQTGLDLTVWTSRHWHGPVENLQPQEHDSIAWFTAPELPALTFADPSYLALLQQLLTELPHDRGLRSPWSPGPAGTRAASLNWREIRHSPRCPMMEGC